MSVNRMLRRAELEARIEQLIALLDTLDGDPDLEDGGDAEPSFGEGRDINGKMEYELEADTSDLEPWLGWDNPQLHDGPLLLPRGWSSADAPEAGEFLDGFRGDGQKVARDLIRQHITERPALRMTGANTHLFVCRQRQRGKL